VLKTALYLLSAAIACLTTARPSPERLLKEAKITLPEAVGIALPEIPEGSAVAARLREEKSRLLYVVDVAQGDAATRLSIDAKTRELVSKAPLKKNYAALVGASRISMAKALELATAKMAGKATRVEFELKKGKAVAEVLVFLNGKLYEVKLDAVTGSVLKVEEEDDDDDDADEDDDDDD